MIRSRFKSTGEGLIKLGISQEKLVNPQEKWIAIQKRQEKILINILDVLADDVPKFDELTELEQLEGGRKIFLRMYR